MTRSRYSGVASTPDAANAPAPIFLKRNKQMIHSDIFLKIGKSHKVCEDYIISGDIPFPYVILADGCSTSKNTEMGARILCHLAKQYLTYRMNQYTFPYLDYDEMGTWIIHNAELTARQLGLGQPCLNATLIIAYVVDDHYHIYMYGDGVVVFQTLEGQIQVSAVEFSKNAPYYLAYKICPESKDLFHKMGQDKIIKTYIGDDEPFIRTYAYDNKSEWSYRADSYKSVMICSDGIETFQKGIEVQPVTSILSEFLSFKSTRGEFLQRRLKKAIKLYENDGVFHMDDLSVGAFVREED